MLETGIRVRRVAVVGILLGLAFFTRDDAAIPCAVMIVFPVIGVDRARRGFAIAVAFGASAAVVGARLMLRWSLYGHLLPNRTY